MKIEKRKKSKSPQPPVALPQDYLKMVEEIFAKNFSSKIKKMKKPRFQAFGEMHPDEILLCLSLTQEKALQGLCVYASCDFDPKASSPTAEDLLSACVDGLANLYEQLLTSSNIRDALQKVPPNWSSLEINRQTVFLRVDQTNPDLEDLTESWLEENDPKLKN